MGDATREQFAKSAEAYRDSEIHARGDDLAVMVDWATRAFGGLDGRAVLDVATGAGHTALAFARAGAVVAALDVTPAMLDVAADLVATELSAGTVAFHLGRAESLPFENATFDVVACRIAGHHFEAPRTFLAEAARVLRRDGRLLLVDNIAPEAAPWDEAMNHIERLRDPSHVRAYTVRHWIVCVTEAGLAPERLDRWHRSKDFRNWVERSRTPPEVVRELQAYILDLPEAAQRYFLVAAAGGQVQRLAHEAMLLAARKQG